MERFKLFIRDALAQQAAKLTLTNGQDATIVSGNGGLQSLSQHGPIDYPWLAKTHEFLFNMPPGAHSPVPKEGSLNIPNLGKLLVLVTTEPAFCISLYFPGAQGNELFEKDKNPQAGIKIEELAETEAAVQQDPFSLAASSDQPFSQDGMESIPFQANNSQPPSTPRPGPVAEPKLAEAQQAINPFAEAKVEENRPTEGDNLFALGELGGAAETPKSVPTSPPTTPASSPISNAPKDLFNVSAFEEPAAPSMQDMFSAPSKHAPSSQSAEAPAFVPVNDIPSPPPVSEDASFDSKEPRDSVADPGPQIPNFASSPGMVVPPEPDLAPKPIVPAVSQLSVHKPSEANPVAAKVPAPPMSSPASAQPLPSPTPDSDIPQIVYGKPKDITTALEGERCPIDDLLIEMVKLGASDLHLTNGQPIIFRVDGEVRRTRGENLTDENLKSLLDPILPLKNRKEFIEANDTDFAYQVNGVGRFRVNIFRNHRGVGSVMRHIPSEILTVEQLGLPASMLKFCTLHKGLVLVTGPTGSGKSTTLAALIDRINKTRKDHILTIEDPIEFVHDQKNCLVNQREVGLHTTGFSRALRAALREDPDIVLIGEMRDLETVHIALETAETGHLVFGTLHTTTAISTIDRIIDQFPAEQQEQIRTMLASSLKGVVAQNLLKKKGGGRVAAHEILIPDMAVASMIRKGDNHLIKTHMQTQKAAGNLLLNEALVSLVIADKVELREAYSKSVDKKEFLEAAVRAGINTKEIIH